MTMYIQPMIININEDDNNEYDHIKYHHNQ